MNRSLKIPLSSIWLTKTDHDCYFPSMLFTLMLEVWPLKFRLFSNSFTMFLISRFVVNYKVKVPSHCGGNDNRKYYSIAVAMWTPSLVAMKPIFPLPLLSQLGAEPIPWQRRHHVNTFIWLHTNPFLTRNFRCRCRHNVNEPLWIIIRRKRDTWRKI